jgi:hypothetical protein
MDVSWNNLDGSTAKTPFAFFPNTMHGEAGISGIDAMNHSTAGFLSVFTTGFHGVDAFYQPAIG